MQQFPLDGTGPLYRQIKRAIAAPILSGTLEPGSRLPSEHTFMDMFRTSRMTVNRALQMLADEGLVVRHRRSGTFVAPQVTEHAVLELRDIADEVTDTGAAHRHEVLECRTVKATKSMALRLGIRAGAPLLKVVCRHFADGEPFVLEDRIINTKAVPEALKADFSSVPPSQWLLENVPWSRAEHAVLAVNASAQVARLLSLETGAACLCVERTTWLAGNPVTFVALTYPGNRHRLNGSFTPGG